MRAFGCPRENLQNVYELHFGVVNWVVAYRDALMNLALIKTGVAEAYTVSSLVSRINEPSGAPKTSKVNNCQQQRAGVQYQLRYVSSRANRKDNT